MWRDRTNLYISYRQSYSHHPTKKRRFAPSNGFGGTSVPSLSEERRGLMSAAAGGYDDEEDGSGDTIIEMDLLPPRWLDVQDEVTEHLAEIAAQTRKLDQLHQKHVLPGFDDEADKRREEREIEVLTQNITRKFHLCQKEIKRIDSMVQEAQHSGGIGRGDETMARNLQVSLATRVGEASGLFRKKQTAYLKKLRSLGGFASPIGGTSTPVQNPYADPSLLESETDRSLSQSTLRQTAEQRQLQQNPNHALIGQREREVESIAQGVIELANIFQDIQAMVIEQGSMLDRIDYNVEKMAIEVKAADKELTVATGYQRRTVKRKIILLLLIIIAGIFILLGIKLSNRSSSSTSPPSSPPVGEPNAVPNPAQVVRFARSEPSFGSDASVDLLKRDWRRRRRRRRGL